MIDIFWLTDAQRTYLAPFFPKSPDRYRLAAAHSEKLIVMSGVSARLSGVPNLKSLFGKCDYDADWCRSAHIHVWYWGQIMLGLLPPAFVWMARAVVSGGMAYIDANIDNMKKSMQVDAQNAALPHN